MGFWQSSKADRDRMSLNVSSCKSGSRTLVKLSSKSTKCQKCFIFEMKEFKYCASVVWMWANAIAADHRLRCKSFDSSVTSPLQKKKKNPMKINGIFFVRAAASVLLFMQIKTVKLCCFAWWIGTKRLNGKVEKTHIVFWVLRSFLVVFFCYFYFFSPNPHAEKPLYCLLDIKPKLLMNSRYLQRFKSVM